MGSFKRLLFVRIIIWFIRFKRLYLPWRRTGLPLLFIKGWIDKFHQAAWFLSTCQCTRANKAGVDAFNFPAFTPGVLIFIIGIIIHKSFHFLFDRLQFNFFNAIKFSTLLPFLYLTCSNFQINIVYV